MRRKGTILLAAGIIIILGISTFLLFRKPIEPKKAEKVRVGVYANSICTLIYIGEQKGFFRRHGLDLTIENYQTGVIAVNDLLTGKVDVATATGYVLAVQGFRNGDLRAIGTISSADIVEVVARRDRGIEKPEDLRGKSIGVAKATATEFFLNSFLSFNGVQSTEVRIVDLKPTEMVSALLESKIDAFVGSTPNFTAKKALTDKAVSWPAQGARDFHFFLITREKLISTRPAIITSLLKGVLEAEAFLKKNEREAQDIMKSILGIDQETLMSTWAKTRFRVRLDQDLLTLMEDEGRWAIKNKLVDAEKIPDYATFLYLEGLKKIKPEAVGVSH